MVVDSVSALKEQLDKNLLDHFYSAEWGAPIVAQIGGSNSQFRRSDSVDYISKILTASPQSFTRGDAQTLDDIRQNLGLKPLQDDAPAEPVKVLDNGLNIENQPKQQLMTSSDWLGIGTWLESWGMNISVFILGMTILACGLLLLAYNNDTIREGAKSAAKTAATAAAV